MMQPIKNIFRNSIFQVPRNELTSLLLTKNYQNIKINATPMESPKYLKKWTAQSGDAPIMNKALKNFLNTYTRLPKTQMENVSTEKAWPGFSEKTWKSVTNLIKYDGNYHRTNNNNDDKNTKNMIIRNFSNICHENQTDISTSSEVALTIGTSLNGKSELLDPKAVKLPAKTMNNGNDMKKPANDVGVCLKIHLHFREDELNTYKPTRATATAIINDQKTLANGNILDGQCPGDDGKKYPDFIGLNLNFELEDTDGKLKAGNLNFSQINVQGSLPFTRQIPGNVYVYNGIGNCKVKCS